MNYNETKSITPEVEQVAVETTSALNRFLEAEVLVRDPDGNFCESAGYLRRGKEKKKGEEMGSAEAFGRDYWPFACYWKDYLIWKIPFETSIDSPTTECLDIMHLFTSNNPYRIEPIKEMPLIIPVLNNKRKIEMKPFPSIKNAIDNFLKGYIPTLYSQKTGPFEDTINKIRKHMTDVREHAYSYSSFLEECIYHKANLPENVRKRIEPADIHFHYQYRAADQEIGKIMSSNLDHETQIIHISLQLAEIRNGISGIDGLIQVCSKEYDNLPDSFKVPAKAAQECRQKFRATDLSFTQVFNSMPKELSRRCLEYQINSV